jgi:hypothetical protein
MVVLKVSSSLSGARDPHRPLERLLRPLVRQGEVPSYPAPHTTLRVNKNREALRQRKLPSRRPLERPLAPAARGRRLPLRLRNCAIVLSRRLKN